MTSIRCLPNVATQRRARSVASLSVLDVVSDSRGTSSRQSSVRCDARTLLRKDSNRRTSLRIGAGNRAPIIYGTETNMGQRQTETGASLYLSAIVMPVASVGRGVDYRRITLNPTRTIPRFGMTFPTASLSVSFATRKPTHLAGRSTGTAGSLSAAKRLSQEVLPLEPVTPEPEQGEMFGA